MMQSEWVDAFAPAETPWSDEELYRAQAYTYEVWWSEADQLFIARCVEIPAAMSHGRTQAEAIENAVDAVAVAIDASENAPENPALRVPHLLSVH
jgi:predicted RNase H-like HicB family nuclease